MQDFKNLTVWQASRRLTRSVYELTVGFPHSEEFIASGSKPES